MNKKLFLLASLISGSCLALSQADLEQMKKTCQDVQNQGAICRNILRAIEVMEEGSDAVCQQLSGNPATRSLANEMLASITGNKEVTDCAIHDKCSGNSGRIHALITLLCMQTCLEHKTDDKACSDATFLAQQEFVDYVRANRTTGSAK